MSVFRNAKIQVPSSEFQVLSSARRRRLQNLNAARDIEMPLRGLNLELGTWNSELRMTRLLEVKQCLFLLAPRLSSAKSLTFPAMKVLARFLSVLVALCSFAMAKPN